MKKLLLVFIVTTASLISFSQKISTAKVPRAVKEGLVKSHPGVTAAWEWEDANYEANFKESGKAVSCVLDKAGTIVETETEVALTDLPSAAQTYIGQHYKGKKLKEIAKIVKATGEVNYEILVSGKDVMFDGNGTHIEKKKEEKEKD